jgi:lipid-A-disaccharide synthase
VKSKSFMLIAGEPSGDLLAAELVAALRERLPEAAFFGAGGSRMAAAGVELAFDLTQHAVVGLPSLAQYLKLRELGRQLLALAVKRQPDFIIGVDYGGFNLRFGHSAREYVRKNPFSTWKPKIIQFISPQVWASRAGRAQLLAADYDLLLSIFPFEKQWYAERVPQLRVEFVGHPMIERFAGDELLRRHMESPAAKQPPHILLLPGSRSSELRQHLPPMLAAVRLIRAAQPEAKLKMVLPNPALAELARSLGSSLDIQIGELSWALSEADVAIASTGTVTMECAFFGVPAVTVYKKPLLRLAFALGIIKVKWFTMPNLLAGEEVYPEFLEGRLTAENVARAALELLQDEPRRAMIKARLAALIASLGGPGAQRRAAQAILSLI